MEGNRAGRASGLALMVAVASLSGCVMNPYIRSSSVPVKPDSSTLCSGWSDSAVGEADALKYATCLRRVMEDKASRHAMMNNGGGPLLLGIAGLAAYRGFQGGHEANIAALTMGGAALYGAQQYLYRAPRESIYLAGAGALACAINQTQRKLLVEAELTPITNLLVHQVEPEMQVAEAALSNADGLGSRVQLAGQCPALQQDLNKAKTAEREARKRYAELTRQLPLAQLRLAQLSVATRTARIDLIAATDAITTTVNQQLVQQQPNPADLAALLARMKLPATSPPATPEEKAEPAPVAPEPTREPATESGAAPVGELEINCGQHTGEVQFYEKVVDALTHAVDRAASDMQVVKQGLDSMENVIGARGAKDDSMQLCYRPPAMSLLPFSLAFAQAGTQVLPDDAPLLIPISGGTPPFVAVATDDQLNGTAEADDAGGYRLRITAGEDAEAGVHTMIATDGSGMTRIFQVKIPE